MHYRWKNHYRPCLWLIPLFLGDLVYVYDWGEDESERRTLLYDHQGGLLSVGDADLYWNLTDDTKQWVTHSIDKTTDAITIYNQ